MSIAVAARRGAVLALVMLMALVLLPVEQVRANDVAPATKSETVKGLPSSASASAQGEPNAAPGGESPAEAPPRSQTEDDTTDGAKDGTVLDDGEGRSGDDPDAVQNEDAPEDAAPSAEPELADRQLSDVVEAPLPFSGLGITGRGEIEPEIYWRALTIDGEWSDWQPVPILEKYDGPDEATGEGTGIPEDGWISDAVWVGEATHLQIDARGADLDDLEVTYIDTAGLSESLPERALRHLRSLSTQPPPADATVGQPNIISRAGWNADESCTSGTISHATPKFTVIHHTATSNTYTRSQAKQQVRNIYHWHTACHGSGNGWWDMGYNFLIDRFGNIYEGRRGGIDKGVIGAHAGGWNTGSFGVGLMGNYNTANPSSTALHSLNTLLNWKFDVHGIPTSTSSTVMHNGQRIPRMVGHRNVRGSYTANPSTTTDCPGQNLYTRMGDIRTALATAPSPTTLGPGETRSVQVTGVEGVPSSGVDAVVVNVNARDPSRATYLTVWPSGEARRDLATLHAQPGDDSGNEIVAQVGSNGRINIYNQRGHVDVTVDVVGYYPTGDIVSLRPRRIFDTRNSIGGAATRFGQRETRSVKVTGVGGVPSSGVDSVMLNVNARHPSTDTYLTVWPRGNTRRDLATVHGGHLRAGANEIVAKVGSNGRVNIYNRWGTTDVTVDVTGYVPSSSSYVSLRPSRVLDTRNSIGGAASRLGQRETRSVQVTGLGGVPSNGVDSVVVNVNARDASQTTYLTVWPSGFTRRDLATLHAGPGLDSANEVTAKVGSNGRINVYNRWGTAHVTVDVVGYYPTGSDYVSLRPRRSFDTR